jgi:hypothetical protein
VSRGELFPLRFLKEGDELGEVFRVHNHGAGIPKDREKDLFGPPAIPDVSSYFSVIPEMCFHKDQNGPNPLVVGGKGSHLSARR